MTMRFDEFELDSARFELRRAGRPLAVQPKVLDLIIYLAQNRHRVVSKDELFRTVWAGVFVNEGSLSQAVSLARKALGDDPEAPRFIGTARGRGFRFIAPTSTWAPAPDAASSVSPPTLEPTATATRDAAGMPVRPSRLFVALHCDDPALGAARHDLANVDEIEIGRGEERSVQQLDGPITRRLIIKIPGDAVSRVHARLVRSAKAWCVLDAQSKNGTFVNGRRKDRRVLRDGDVFECGRTLFLLREGLAATADSDVDGALGHHVARILDELGTQGTRFTAAAGLGLLRHRVPDNLRELKRRLRAAVERAGGARIEAAHLFDGATDDGS